MREALELDPRNATAGVKLGRRLLGRGESAEALELLDPFQGNFEAEGLAARARLEADLPSGHENGAQPLRRSFSAWDRGELEDALDGLQEAISADADPERRDLVRKVMVAIFTELGVDHPTSREYRRRLAAVLT